MMNWWLEGARLLGHDVDGVSVIHTPPRREMISPEREVPALLAARRAGQRTLTDIVSETGRDLHQHLDELTEENRLLDERGLVLDSDPRKVSAAGLTQARTGGGLALPPTGDPDAAPPGEGGQGDDGDPGDE